jgi:hypothetical protein
MKVLDLQCRFQHVFEGWFGSEIDFQAQLGRGLVLCPLCGDATITKRLSAPRLNFGAVKEGQREDASFKADASGSSSTPDVVREKSHEVVAGTQQGQALMGAWMDMARRVLANTADVGDQFAEEARKIHYGETEERSIRGRATRDETEALLEEGIAVMPFILPEALKGPVQ